MNSNTIVSLFGGTGRNQIASQTLASVTETEFRVNTDTANTTAIAVLTLPQQGDKVGSFNPQDPTVNAAILGGTYGNQYGRQLGQQNPGYNSSSFDTIPFLLRLTGLATPASNAGNSLDIKIYQGTSKSGQLIADTAAVPEATTTTAVQFIVEAECLWNSTAQTIIGQFWFSLPGTSGTVYSTWKTIATAPTSVAVANLQFVASAQWGNAAGGVVAVKEFSASDF